MRKGKILNIIGFICVAIWITTIILQVMHPHPYRGLIGNIVMVIGLLFFHRYAKINNLKSPLYDPDKKKHIHNWIIFITLDVLIVFLVVILFLKLN